MTPHDLECATSALLREEVASLKAQMDVLSDKGKIENEKYVELAYAIDQDKQAWRQENSNYESAIQELKTRNKQLEDLLAEAHFYNAGRWGSSRA